MEGSVSERTLVARLVSRKPNSAQNQQLATLSDIFEEKVTNRLLTKRRKAVQGDERSPSLDFHGPCPQLK